MSIADHRDVDVGTASDLLLRNDDLRGKCIFRVRNGMVEQTDAPDNAALLAHPVGHVARVAVHLLALGDLVARPHADHAAPLS